MSVRMESQAGTSRAAESNPHLFDVFLNHHGQDVKKTFGSHLYAALRGDGLRPFLDANDIEHGRHVFKSIDEALKGSCVHVAIFSERYAESKHCLNELCMMLESGKDILPVFYHVDPADLRRVDNRPFEEGFRKHSEQETEEQISKWKEALREISVYRGLRLDEVNGNEEELVRRILAAVRRLMSNVLPGAIEGVDPQEAEAPEVDAIGVESPEAEAPEAPVVTFNPGNRRLNLLVLGDPISVEAVISRICGAGTRQTQMVEDHVNLRECRNSSPPMCLYSHTQGINRKNFKDIKTFVNVRNIKWRREKVKASWLKEVHECPGSRNRPALFPDSTLRLHAIWVACRKLSDLPNHLEWPKFTEILCELPLQVLVIEQHRTRDLDLNFQQEFNIILQHRSDFFPNAHDEFMEELIVKVALNDGDLRERLWCACWSVKTRVEIGNAAKIIREIRKQLGSEGVSVQRGLCARMRKEVLLSLTREFVYNFLCTYWDIPQDSLRRVLPRRTSLRSQARGSEIAIEPCRFVEFCLIVAAIILYNAQDNARNPNVSSESSLDQLLQTEARDCYNSYFAPSSNPLDYEKMVFEDIRLFLERIFERTGRDPRQAMVSVDRNSLISKIMKLIRPR